MERKALQAIIGPSGGGGLQELADMDWTFEREPIAAVAEWQQWSNIREMHKASAVGVAQELVLDDTTKSLWVGVKVVDDAAWQKVKDGVYKGFSIGGKALKKVSDIIDPSSKKVLFQAKKKINRELFQKLEELKIKEIPITKKELNGAFSVLSIKDVVKTNEEIGEKQLEQLLKQGKPFEIYFPLIDKIGEIILNTLKKDSCIDTNQALGEIYKKLSKHGCCYF